MLVGFLIPSQLFAQATIVTGKINGSDGSPIAGVSVLVNGTRVGTTTDISGNFSLKVSNPNATLEISSLNYVSQIISLNGRANISVVLLGSAKELEQVVVIGYGTQRKKRFNRRFSDYQRF